MSFRTMAVTGERIPLSFCCLISNKNALEYIYIYFYQWNEPVLQHLNILAKKKKMSQLENDWIKKTYSK
jgi:hypothetical protein